MTSAPPPPTPSADPPPVAYAPPPGPPARPPLRRSSSDKVIGGVSGGLADYSGIDALLWRVGFVALALAGPGVPVYLLLWLLMPAERGTGEPRRVRPAGPRSPIPRVVLAALLIVVGLLAGLDRLTALDIGPVGYLGPALLLVGLGLVLLAFTGGGRGRGGLIAVGAVLSLALVAGTADWEEAGRDVGDRRYTPGTVADVRPVYDHGMGNLTLDLTAIDLSDLDGPVTTRIDQGMGDVEVLVPRSADVRVDVGGGMGEVDVLDLDSDGGSARGGGSPWSGDDTPEFDLTINAGMGDVEVRRA